MVEKSRVTEDSEQIAVVQYCRLLGIPIIHIPNEGKRSIAEGYRMKQKGLESGVPDLFLPIAKGGYHGLWIEMKVGNNKTTDKQRQWLRLLNENGYAVCVRYGSGDAIAAIDKYLNLKEDYKNDKS